MRAKPAPTLFHIPPAPYFQTPAHQSPHQPYQPFSPYQLYHPNHPNHLTNLKPNCAIKAIDFKPRVRNFIRQEALEPTLSWGIRMAVVSVAPILWGRFTGNLAAAEWITLAAECICWVELKGAFGQRLRVMLIGTLLALLFGALGSICGHSLAAGVAGMLVVGFLAAVFKNLGDRGAGLAICLFLMYIIGNAHPPENTDALLDRCQYILAGGAWNAVAGLAVALFMPVQQPYRRSIARIWSAVSALADTLNRGWDERSARSSARDIYLKEKDVRLAIDQSFAFHESMAHQVRHSDAEEYALAQVRKATALTASYLLAQHEELEGISLRQLPEALRLRLSELFRAIRECAELMGIYVLSLKGEDALLVRNRADRVRAVLVLLQEFREPLSLGASRSVRRIAQLAGRALRLTDHCLELLGKLDDVPVFRSYSLIKTVFVLHPRHWYSNLRLLFNVNSQTLRYAIRTAVGAALALGISQGFGFERGYWLPLTVMIVGQPYFGATFQKAIDRIAGTVMGGLAGGIILQVKGLFFLKELMLFVTAALMVYFLRKKYMLATLCITINLVLLFSISSPDSQASEEHNMALLWFRLAATLGGAALAVGAGFALLPGWDRQYLPRHIARAMRSNYSYFTATFYTGTGDSWTRCKRQAEGDNSNAFDSFSRYTQEPGGGRRDYAVYYQLITHNVRITRELNNIHLEQEARSEEERAQPATSQETLLATQALNLFNRCLDRLRELLPEEPAPALLNPADAPQPRICLSLYQKLYLEKLVLELQALNHNLAQLALRREERG